MHKRWVQVVIAIAVVIILVIVLVPLFINADTFRPRVESQLSASLGRPVSLGHLSLSVFRGSLVANNVAIADDPAFSSSPFLQAKSFRIGVHLVPLIFHHQIEVTDLALESPSINLIHAQNGKWNFSTLGGASKSSPSGPAQIPELSVGQLTVSDGSATVSSLPATGKPFVYNDINVSVRQFSLRGSFPFQLSAKLPGSGSLALNGNAGPLNQVNAADTPFSATLQLKHFDPVAAGLVQPDQGIKMVVDLDSKLTSNGTTLTSTGKAQATHLQLARTGSPAPNPVNVDYSFEENLVSQAGRIQDIAIHTGSVAAHVTGNYQLTPRAVVLDLHLAAPNLPIDQLQQLLPAFGVSLPTGSQLRGGTLTANLAITGPATATTIAGPVEIDNTTLAGFDLGSKIQGLNPFGKGNGGTAIQTLRATISSSPQITQISNIYGNLPQLGTATGSGTVTPAGALNFKMVATITSSNAAGQVANQAVNTATNFIGGFLHPNRKPAATNAARGIPLSIGGTTANPSIRANVVSMLK